MTSFFPSTSMLTKTPASTDSNATIDLEMELPNLLRERWSTLLPPHSKELDSLQRTQKMALGLSVPDAFSRITIRVPQCYWSVAMGRMYLIGHFSRLRGVEKNS